MKKILLSLFTISGLFLLTGCSLTGTTVDDNSDLLEQVSLLQQQMSGLNSEVQELKEQNDELIEENETIKISLSDQNSGASILLTQNEELKKDIEKYKQVLVQERLKNKNTTISSSIKDNNSTSIKSNGNKTFRDKHSSLSFEYPNQRKITDGNYTPSDNDCDPVVIKKLYNPEEPLRCFEAGCTPEIMPSISFLVSNTSCQYMQTTCISLDSGLEDDCNQLVALGTSEATAAATISIGLSNGSNYYVLKGDNGNIVIGDFTDGIVQHKKGFFVKNGYIASISDNEGIYKDDFDDIIKTIDF